ncbi:tyr_phosphatase_2 domain-containing protein [Haematococcus lacustris]|uniref:Tyr_phosphatase_2 domain-containing protein n=1 Tax=Haematococcus lacustris TaxID=44745 RepID=A0A699YBW3_HAELA|nr:tyr_phosphatase_2 domain-containing protein [Haematococcus lacustris]
MRFPKPGHPPVQQHHGQAPIADYPVSRPHSLTLMDGEMVVDHAADGYHRRYLVYDMAVCNGKPLMTEKWIKRFEAVRTMVIDPRSKEQKWVSRHFEENNPSPSPSH